MCPHNGNYDIYLVSHVAVHGRSFKDPNPVFCASMKVMGIALELLDLGHALVGIVVPKSRLSPG
jgi:hypothetical protein